MGKLGNLSDMDVMNITGGNKFQFSAVKMDKLGATEYTLVTIALDRSGSVNEFKADLLKAVKSVIGACKKSPRAENLMIRLIDFNDTLNETHGFKLLNAIDENDYQEPNTVGMTSLFDATYSAVGATLTFAQKLLEQNYNANGICFVITDGMDNRSTTTPSMIAQIVNKAKLGEEIESLVTVLIGINTKEGDVSDALSRFASEAGLTQYIDAGDATAGKLAKLAEFVSKSISSQSQSLGTGGASIPQTF